MKSLQSVFSLLLFCLITSVLYAQNDSVIIQPKPDSVKQALIQDSVKKMLLVPITDPTSTSTYKQYLHNAYLPMDAVPIKMLINYKEHESKDFLFYLIFGNVFLLAFIKLIFPKYFKNLFMLFFQTSLRQKQTREQLLQDGLASLLINLLFLISTGLFITLVTKYQSWSNLPFKTLYGYLAAMLMLIYIGKFVFVSFAGWVFNNKEAASGYIFLVSMVNRIMGILLIPFTIFLAFAKNEVTSIVITLSIILVVVLFLYRYFVSFVSLRNDLKLNAFHFLLYLCAVEILPILLLYKLLVNYIG